MKARLVPVYFHPGRDTEFDAQLDSVRTLLADAAEILPPVPLGSALPDADAALFPQLLGAAFRRVDDFRHIAMPILLVTSEFGTLSMWDWEIMSYLRDEGVPVIAPYSVELTRTVCSALAARRDLRSATFVVYQDKPGEAGFQPEIFKRFYWWEDECIERLRDRFGVTVVSKSFEEFGQRAKEIPEDEARSVWQERNRPAEGLEERSLLSAAKVYLALRREVDADPSIRGMGINCLNESHFSDTTPCLAWDLLYEDTGVLWACEGDLMSLMTMTLLNRALGARVVMTNIYPFLLGQAALHHEKIPDFPKDVDDPENHLLLGHCGYFGVVPQCFATDWTMRRKVLAIVDDNAHALDARLPTGDVTLAKLGPTMDVLQVIEADLRDYVQYPGSDCRNSAVVRVPDGHALMRNALSHHQCLALGRLLPVLELTAGAFDLKLDAMRFAHPA